MGYLDPLGKSPKVTYSADKIERLIFSKIDAEFAAGKGSNGCFAAMGWDDALAALRWIKPRFRASAKSRLREEYAL
jgi:hypothetical protein